MKTSCLIGVCAVTCGLLLIASGCGRSSNQSIQGHWSGFNAKRPDYACTVSIAGDQLEYHGADTNDWVRGTFIVREDVKPKEMDLTILAPPRETNHMIFAIYQVKGADMTVAISSGQRPVDFSTNTQNEVFNFKRD